MLKHSGMAAFFPKWHSFGTALACLVLSLEKPVQNTNFLLYHSQIWSGTGTDAYMCAVYCSDYVRQSSHGMKVALNLYLLDSGGREFDAPWVINWWELWWPRGAQDSQRTGTHLICLQSPSERFPWPKIQGWWGSGHVVELDLISVFLSGVVALASCIVFGNLNRDVSHSCVSARISTRSRNTRSLLRAWRSKASKSNKSATGYTSHWPCYIQSQINLQLVHNLSQTE